MTMPKPEPLQLLFISIFVYFFVRRDAVFSNYWFFLGIALGVKISTLPLIPFFYILAYWHNNKVIKCEILLSSLNKIISPILVGLSIAVPILIPAVSLFILGLIFLRRIYKDSLFNKSLLVLLFLGYFIFILIYCNESLYIWLLSTVLNTNHGSDNFKIDFIEWLIYFFKNWMKSPFLINILFFLVCFTLIILSINRMRKNYTLFKSSVLPFGILVSGIIINLIIFMFTKRLWGYYLYIGVILFFIGFLLLIENNFSNKYHNTKFENNISFAFFIIFIFVIFKYWIPSTINELNVISRRTKTKEYLENLKSYEQTNSFIDKLSSYTNRPINVLIHPNNFIPTNSKKIRYTEFFGEIHWNDSIDILILDPLQNKTLNTNSHVILNDSCISNSCYVKMKSLSNGGEILVNTNFYTISR